MPSFDELKIIHDHYCQLSGLPVPYTHYHEYSWGVWLHYGFTKDDLEPVIRYIKKRIRDGRRERESLMFRNLIAHPETFADDLAMARATLRQPVIDQARQSVLTASGRSAEAVSQPVRSIAQVMAGDAALKELLALRDSL